MKAPETKAAQPRAIGSAGIVGGGTMGAGIAVAMLDAGLPVTMVERDEPSLARGRANVEKVYDALVAKGRMSAEAKSRVMARFSGATSYDAFGQVDLVIEAVFEDMAVKKAVFAELDRVCKPGAVLATNTSYLDIDEIAASISRPQDVLGLHFFSPANIMKLLEIVVPAQGQRRRGRHRLRAGEAAAQGGRCAPACATASSATASSRCTARPPST